MMAFNERNLDDYVDVAERMVEFYAKYPDGSLGAANPDEPYHLTTAEAHWCRRCIGERSVKRGQQWVTCPRCEGTGLRRDDEPHADVFVVYVAAAYRTPDDKRPGIGTAWEPFPGRTPYTRDSEVMNAETSAWGRAMAALGIATKKGIASRQEVANRRQEREDGLPTNRDGSLSRSRTTDAEKASAGVMTSAQHAAHTALQPKQAEVRGKVTRIKVADDADPWQIPPEDRPGSILPDQRSKIMAKLGKMPRDDRIDRIARLAGRGVQSTNDLSITEAAKVLAGLGE